MAKFVTCSTPKRKYRSSEIVNHAVNIDLCQRVEKARVAWYPDNVGIPSIRFVGCGTEWSYMSDAERDADYDRIIGVSL